MSERPQILQVNIYYPYPIEHKIWVANKGTNEERIAVISNFLKPLIDSDTAQIVIDCIIQQRDSGHRFPNAQLFLDDNNRPISIDRSMEDWKKAKLDKRLKDECK